MDNSGKNIEASLPSVSADVDHYAPPPSYDFSQPTFIALPAGPSSNGNLIYEAHAVPVQLVQIQTIGMIPNASLVSVEVSDIRDHMCWSLLNICMGGLLLGLIGVVLSFIVRKRKEDGDLPGAKSVAYWTVAWNTFATLTGISLNIVAAIFLINYFGDS